MNKCMEYRVEGRRPVGRPRRTWVESVDADMDELESDREDVHDRTKWRKNVMLLFSFPDLRKEMGCDSNFQILIELPVPPQAAGVVGTFYIYISF